MKKTSLFLATVVLLAACNNTRQTDTIEDEAYIEACDSTGIMDVYAYEGNIKAHGNQPAAHYMVVISEELDSINGTYTMTTTYIVADSLNNTTHKSHGRKYTHRGLPGHSNATVYTLVPDSGATDSVFLYVESDTTVVWLDKDMKHPKHTEHFRLWKVKHHQQHHDKHKKQH